MIPENRQDRLRRLTTEALGRYAAAQREVGDRQMEPPVPGDLFVLEETAELAVEWAVIGHDMADVGRLLMVPADTYPLAGSADVEVPDDASSGPLYLRCRYGIWRDAAELDLNLRTRSLEPSYVHRAWHKWQAVKDGSLIGSAPEQEVDAKPEYDDWSVEVLRVAQAAFGAGSGGRVAEHRTVVDFPSRRTRHRPAAFYGLAASILLLATLGLLAGLMTQRQRIAELSQEHRTAEEQVHRELERLRKEAAFELGEPLVNVPVVFLNPRETLRGPAALLDVPAGARLYQLVLQTTDLQLYPTYRLEILRKGTDQEIWSHSELTRIGTGRFSVLVPRDWLPAGHYRLRLYGLDSGKAEWVEEYGLDIALEDEG